LMARQRFIHPEFWSDPSVGQLTARERLFFIGCFSNADDDGRLLGNPAWLRSMIFPYDDIPLDEIATMRDRIAGVCRNFIVYAVDGVDYIALRQWGRYQKPKYPKPSNIPPPPSHDEAPDSVNVSGITSETASSAQENDCGNVCSMGRVGMGRDRVGSGRELTDDAAPVDNSVSKPKDDGCDSDTRLVVTTYWNVFGKDPSAVILADLFDWIEKLGGQLVAEALRRTAEANAESWKYTQAILLRWEKARVMSMADVERLDAEHKSRAQGRALADAPPPEPPPPKRIEYDPAELERLRAEADANEAKIRARLEREVTEREYDST